MILIGCRFLPTINNRCKTMSFMSSLIVYQINRQFKHSALLLLVYVAVQVLLVPISTYVTVIVTYTFMVHTAVKPMFQVKAVRLDLSDLY